eukprot:g23197.t1
MGVDLLEQHLAPDCFLRRGQSSYTLRAVFPATTPAALTTLATGVWPGQHGLPGWELRDQKACEFPKENLHNPIQLTVLDSQVRDKRTGKPVWDMGFTTKEVYIEEPWVAKGESSRKMKFVNAYNTTEFTDWYQEKYNKEVMTIEETSYETLGKPEGSEQAIQYFNNGIDCILQSVEEAEKNDWKSYVYMYTAHPDKHMHELGIAHPEVTAVLRGFSDGLERLWQRLKMLDATLLVTADHGHVTVEPEEMVILPQGLLDCLEYANIGVHGKGRHAYFHCRSGRQEEFQQAWELDTSLSSFILLPIDTAVEEGLFGPDPPVPSARPRLGDFVGLSTSNKTLVTPEVIRAAFLLQQELLHAKQARLVATDVARPILDRASEAKDPVLLRDEDELGESSDDDELYTGVQELHSKAIGRTLAKELREHKEILAEWKGMAALETLFRELRSRGRGVTALDLAAEHVTGESPAHGPHAVPARSTQAPLSGPVKTLKLSSEMDDDLDRIYRKKDRMVAGLAGLIS